MNNKNNVRPNLFDYFDSILFLNSYFEYRKSAVPTFSYTEWARELGLQNKTLLRFILQRKRTISVKTSEILKVGLNFKEEERKYFDLLINYTQAKTELEKNAYGTQLIKIQRQTQLPVSIDASIAIQNAYGPVILSLLTYKDLKITLQSLSRFLQAPLATIEEALQPLIEAGIISTDAEGILTFEGSQFRIPNSDNNQNLEDYHKFWLSKSIEALKSPSQQRKFRSLKVALTENEFIQALEKINDFAFTFLSKFSQDSLLNRRLYMLEAVLFPVSGLCTLDEKKIDPSELQIK